MTVTRSFMHTVKVRAERDPAFCEALAAAISAVLDEPGQPLEGLRDPSLEQLKMLAGIASCDTLRTEEIGHAHATAP